MTDRASASVVLTHDVGLHARPSVRLAQLAKKFDASIELAVSADGPWLNAKSVSKVMAAKIRKDTELFFQASGDDAQRAVDELIALVERDFELDEQASTGN